ncbi:TPA: hypothetical protein NJ039_004492 [Vibrio parahaemolyticus]|uniref:hypothetical protein n=1 Tax=Vibrio parahaemolyticus TaxID=670 RepID=UPI000471F132|nr:hypothetical protein [Vibrio parahaemolyticus]HCG5490330.1 hypothetical protein [Vibrio parahaemolyticus]
MKNLWPDSFEVKDSKSVKEILDEQSSFLPELTNGMVLAEVKEMSAGDGLFLGHNNDFNYTYHIKGRFLKKYSFKVLDFSHPITMYPVLVTIDKSISRDLNITVKHTIQDELEFFAFLERIFKSEKLRDIIASIMKLSPKQMT